MMLELRIAPDNSPELADAARDLMHALAGVEPDEAVSSPAAEVERGGEWIAAAGMLLAAPGAATAVLDLADRLSRGKGRGEARRRIEPVLTRAQAARSEGQQVTLTVGEKTLDLGRVSVDDVLDALATDGIKWQGSAP